MKTVRKLNDDNTDILCHRYEHLTKVLGLHLNLISIQVQLSQLCNTIHKKRHIRVELFGNLIQSHSCIFNNIMKKTCNYGFFIHLKVGKYYGNTNRVNDIRFTRFTLLVFMLFFCDPVGLLHHAEVPRWMVGLNSLYETFI